MNRLRTETAAVHRHLEDRLGLENWLTSAAAYRTLLERFYGIYAPLEPALTEALKSVDWPLAWDKRLKVPLLLSDLQVFGLQGPEVEKIPLCQDLPPLTTDGRLLGVLYVVEGATLGGQTISRMIADRLGIDANAGAAFFNGYQKETGAMWKAFAEVIETQAKSPEIERAMIAGAVDMFSAFENWTCGSE